jgi:CheY-like chemotaxis protein
MIANTMPSLLIIDDHTCGSRTLVKTLRSVGYAVEVALDQQEVIDLFRLCPADAVIMDCHPEIAGRPIAPILRRISPDIPIIMFSGFCGVPCNRLRDADACIQKGNVVTLLETLRVMLCSRGYGLCQSVAA